MTIPSFDPVAPEPDLPGAATEPLPAARTAFEPTGPESVGGVSGPAASGASRIFGIALGAAMLVAVAGVAFAGGRATAAVPGGNGGALPGGNGGPLPGGNGGNGGELPGASFDLNGNGNGRPGDDEHDGPGDGQEGRPGGPTTLEGIVEGVAADSITVRLSDGRTATVGLDPATTYHQAVGATAADVTSGATVRLQISGGFRSDDDGPAGGTAELGTAGDVTVVP
jgi:hypothetical protein